MFLCVHVCYIWAILQEKYNNCNDKSVSDLKKFNINLSYNITEGFIIANKNAYIHLYILTTFILVYGFLHKTKTTPSTRYTRQFICAYTSQVQSTCTVDIWLRDFRDKLKIYVDCTMWILHVSIKTSARRNHTNDNSVQKLWADLAIKRTKYFGIKNVRHVA